MSDELSQWQTNNEAYLAAALAWLRLRLQAHIDGASKAPLTAALPAPPPPSTSLFAWAGSAAREEAAPVVETPIGKAATALAEAEKTDPPPAMVLLAERLGLSRFEQETLLLCAAMELDTSIPGLCAQAQGDAGRPFPTFALAMVLFDNPAWDVLSPERPLRYWRLIDITQPAGQPLTTSPLRADERIVNYLKGLNYLDDRLDPLLVPFDALLDRDDLPESQRAAADLAVRYIDQSPRPGPPPVIQLLGLDNLSKQLVAQRAAAALRLHIYRLPIELLPPQVADLETVARLWQRESVLLPIALYLDAHEAGKLSHAEGQSPPVQRFLGRSYGVFFLGTREVQPGLGSTVAAVEIDKPTTAEQATAWGEALGDAAGSLPALLAGQFNLNSTAIRQIAGVALAVPEDQGGPLADRLWQACLGSTRPRMDLLAQRLEPKATWEDIVLPDPVLVLLHQVAEQVRQRTKVYDEWGFRQKMSRGLGISALFSGESGTGKTMAAEVLANELRLNLYRIDLSQVVSKYIGETEKNLRQLFDAAEDGGAILFFDEADALFGKRSEVRDSHDRYANIEINYLLQRMEEYRGLAILATNMKSALDPAFVRRLRFIVNFPFPEAAQRKSIWQRAFPLKMPLENLDYDRLGSLNMSGGGIHNSAITAAFLAAQAGTPVTMALVLEAVQAELRKMDRPYRQAEFR